MLNQRARVSTRAIHAHFQIPAINLMRKGPDVSKRPINLLVNARTLELANELGMNLSQTVDAFLGAEVERRYWERWNDGNKDAISAASLRVW